MSFAIWITIVGALLVGMAVFGTVLKRLPLSSSMVYLAVGYMLGPTGWALTTPDPRSQGIVLEHAAEVALLISLFGAGMKLSLPLKDKRWQLPLRLAFVSMILTIALTATIAVFGFALPLGAAVLLGAILAPTDPVLASDVQVENANDRDQLRFSLTGEGGLNDGTAFPFVMLGLGLLGLHDLGSWGWRWLLIDVIWGAAAGLLIGAVLGRAIGKWVVHVRVQHKEAVGLDELLVLGLIGLSYGVALLCHGYGFLAVFAAGLALQRVPGVNARAAELPVQPANADQSARALATHPEHAGTYMIQVARGFNEQLERIAEAAIVLLVGSLIAYAHFSTGYAWFIAALFLLVRPASVWLGLLRWRIATDQWALISWFGIRGIGSVYYVLYAMNHGLSTELSDTFMGVTLAVVAASIVLHGISVTPLMKAYTQRRRRSQRR